MAKHFLASGGWWKYRWQWVKDRMGTRLPRPAYLRSDDEHWQQWQMDVKTIQRLVADVFNRRHVFQTVEKMLVNNPEAKKEGQFVYDWLLEQYGNYISMAIRREIDRDSDVLSLARLLENLRRTNSSITKERWLAHFAGEGEHLPSELQASLAKRRVQDWARLCGDSTCISKAVLNRDLKTLSRQAAPVKRFADKSIAHRALAASYSYDGPPTKAELEEVRLSVKDVDAAMDEIERVLQKYYLILTGSNLVHAEPTMQFDWTTPFRVAWLKHEQVD